MDKVETSFEPTLWRTYRVLSNVNRLRCLKAVLVAPGLTVELAARAVNLTEPKTSLALRALQARGLIACERRSRWVLYDPDPEPSVRAARSFLLAMKEALITRKMPEEEVALAAKAYTHPRRIDLIRALAFTGPIDRVMFSSRVQISPQAFNRHLRMLTALGVVSQADGVCELARPKTKLARDLLRIAVK